MVTERDIAILLAVVRYYVLSRPQVQRLCFPTDAAGRVTRRRLQYLVDAHLLNRQKMLFTHPNGGSPACVYFPSALGAELLAQHFDDERYLTTTTLAPTPHHVPHWLAVAETHIAFDAAIAQEKDARIETWLNEWDVVNKDESAPEKRFRLYSLLRESPRLICAPDAGFLLSVQGHKKVFYLEQDRATTGARQVAEGKSKGYAAMAELDRHLRHFPEATVKGFTVLMVAPNRKRRDILREAIKDKPGAALWRFTTVEDLKPETMLHTPIFYPCVGEPSSLIKQKSP